MCVKTESRGSVVLLQDRENLFSRYQATLAQPFMLASTGQGDTEGVPSYTHGHKRRVYVGSFQLKLLFVGGIE